eukprot:g4863.t1
MLRQIHGHHNSTSFSSVTTAATETPTLFETLTQKKRAVSEESVSSMVTATPLSCTSIDNSNRSQHRREGSFRRQDSMVSSLWKRALEIRRENDGKNSYLQVKRELIWEFGADAWKRNKEPVTELLRGEVHIDSMKKQRNVDKAIVQCAQARLHELSSEFGVRNVSYMLLKGFLCDKFGEVAFERNKRTVRNLIALHHGKLEGEVARRTLRRGSSVSSLVSSSSSSPSGAYSHFDAPQAANDLLERGEISFKEYSDLWFVTEEDKVNAPIHLRKIEMARDKDRDPSGDGVVSSATKCVARIDEGDDDDDATFSSLKSTASSTALTVRHVLKGHSDQVNDCAASCDYFVSVSDDASVRVWNAENRVCSAVFKEEESLNGCDIAGNRIIVASDDETVSIWDVSRGNLVGKLRGHTDSVRDCVFVDPSIALSVSFDRSIRLWDLSQSACVEIVGEHSLEVNACAANGTAIYTASDDKTVALWDIRRKDAACTGRFVGHEDWVHAVSVKQGTPYVATCSSDGTGKVWDVRTFDCVVTLNGHKGALLDCTLCAGGGRAITASEDSTLKIWDVRTGICLETLVGHEGGVNACCIALGGKALLSASRDSTTSVWTTGLGGVWDTQSRD